MRRLAEQKMPNASMKAVSGHSKDNEVARYTEAVNQEHLAEDALLRLSSWESRRVNQPGPLERDLTVADDSDEPLEQTEGAKEKD